MKEKLPILLLASILSVSPSASMAVDFETEVKPVLREKCGKCHTGPKAKGKLRYDNSLYLKKRIGGDDPAIVPGKPLDSLLIQKASLPRTDTDAMPPPRRGDPLTTSEISLIKQWITEGASLEKGDSSAPAPAPTTTTGEPAAFDPKKLYTWTSTAGTSLQAAFVKLDEKTVVLRKGDGSELSVSMSQLAPASRKQANDFAAAQ